jgi:hypothetical protein
MDFTHYSVTTIVAFTVNTQVVLSAELFAVDVTIGATGNFVDGLCGGGIFVQVVSVTDSNDSRSFRVIVTVEYPVLHLRHQEKSRQGSTDIQVCQHSQELDRIRTHQRRSQNHL